MKKYAFMFMMSFLILLTSCSNIVSPNEELEMQELQFTLGEEVSKEISEALMRSSGVSGDSTVTARCELLGIQDFITEETVLLKNLDGLKFSIKKIPLNVKFRVKISVLINGNVMYEGFSDLKKLSFNEKSISLEVLIEKKKYTIKYELFGNGTNNENNPDDYYLDSKISLNAPVPKNDFYDFAGWYLKSDFSGNKINLIDLNSFLGDVTLYAKWIYKADVTSLTATRGNKNVRLNWIKPGESNFGKIVISCPDLKNNIEITDQTAEMEIPLPNGKKYNFTVKCVDKNGFESRGVTVRGETWYALTEDVEVLPEGTDGSAGTNGKYVLFGDFPQSKKADTVHILENVVNIVKPEYLLGDDGYYYKYEVKDGSGVYYKVEPIKWRVLTDNYKDGTGVRKGKLLMAENALTALDFYTKVDAANLVNVQKTADVRKIDGKDVYGNNYKYSNIRAYLNGLNGSSYNAYDYSDPSSGFISFIDSAFTNKSKGNLVQVNVDNSIASTGMSENKYVCENTDDKVFLMSYKEMTNSEYGFKTSSNESDSTRNRKVTYYSRDKAAVDGVVIGTYVDYWLRSPSADANGRQTSNITYNNTGTLKSYDVTNNFGRIVPAIVVNF